MASHTLLMADFFVNRFNRVTFGVVPKASLAYLSLLPLIYWRVSDVATFILLGLAYIGVNKMEPFERQFMLSDVRIQHTYTEHQQVLNVALFIYSCVIPFAIILVFGVVFNRKQRAYKMYVALLGLLLLVVTTALVTNALKNYIGRHRPDFLVRCAPRDGTPEHQYVEAKDVCTTLDHERLMDGFRTTPSGHSLISFLGLHYLSLWLFGQFIVGNPMVGGWRAVLCMVPTLGLVLIALTRTQDYRHHFIDVVIGGLIGVLVSWWSYFRLFPWYAHDKAYNPVVYLRVRETETELPRFNQNYRSLVLGDPLMTEMTLQPSSLPGYAPPLDSTAQTMVPPINVNDVPYSYR